MPGQNPDEVAIDLVANLDNFDRRVKQSANDFGGEMTNIEKAAIKAEAVIDSRVRAMEAAAKRLGQPFDATAARAKVMAGEITKATDKLEAMKEAANDIDPALEDTADGLDKTATKSRTLANSITSIGNQIAAGGSPFLILTRQGSTLAAGIDRLGGKFSKFVGFLGTWQGALLLAAGTIAAQFIPKLIETGDEIDDLVEKLKEAEAEARNTERANELFARTLEGVRKAADDAEEAIESLRLVQKGQAEQTVENIRENLTEAETLRAVTEALILQLKVRAQERVIGTDPSAQARQGARGDLLNTIERLEDDLIATDRELDRLRAALDQAVSFETVERETRGTIERINDKFDAMIDKAADAADASKESQAQLAAEIKKINEARDAEIERYRETERERKKRDRERGTKLPEVTGREIAAALGTTITSGLRTPEQNRAVGGAENSFHLSGEAIDIPLTVNGEPLTKAGIRKVLEPLGVEIRELLGPGDRGHSDHFHIAFNRRRLGRDRIAEDRQRALDRESRRQQAFENELAKLQGDEIDARQSLIESAEEIAALEMQAIQISRDRYNNNLDALVEQKKLTDEEAEQLRELNNQRAELRAELVKRREEQRKFRIQEADAERALDFAQDQIAVAADLLRSQQGVAKTAKDRKAIEERLINLQFDEERLQLRFIIAQAERLKIELDRIKTQRALSDAEKRALANALDQAAIAQARLGTVDERQANEQQGNAEANASPLESFFGSIPSEAGEINEALEEIAAGGLASVVDGLTDAIVNFRSLKDVGLSVLQGLTTAMVKLALQQIILKVVGQTAGNAAVAATTGQAAATASAWAPAAAFASLATLGANAGPASAALAGVTALSQALAVTGGLRRREGGPIFGPGGPRDDMVNVRASNGEYMIRAQSVRRLGRRALDHINRTGELPEFSDSTALSRSISPANTPISRGGRDSAATLSDASVGRLAQVVAEAASAMPDVNLYPSLSPKAAMEALLSDPGAQRLLFDFFGDNSNKFNSVITR